MIHYCHILHMCTHHMNDHFPSKPGACSTAHQSNRLDHRDGLMLDRSAVGQLSSPSVEQNGSDCRQAIHNAVYRLPAIAAILFYWITMKVVLQLTCLTLGRPNSPAYSTGELLEHAPGYPTAPFHFLSPTVQTCASSLDIPKLFMSSLIPSTS